jgi:hypothetical protein
MDSTLINFWDDETLDDRNARLRTTIPERPSITINLQVVTGGQETLAYLALQIRKSRDKGVVMRALASAIAILFSEKTVNYTGSAMTPVPLTGLDPIVDDNVPGTQVITTNFIDASATTVDEVRSLLDCDSEELGAYFGVLCLAGVKALTDRNKTAFNERRVNAVKAVTVEELRIFTPDSLFLSDIVLKSVYAAFNSWQPVRCHLIERAALKMGQVYMGPTASFATMFLLLQDQGMSALRIIKEAVKKYPWIRTEFPELNPELVAAQNGIRAISTVETPGLRPFIKAIWGSNFVPVQYSTINNLLGVCKYVMVETTPSYENYAGGARVSNIHEQRIREHIGISTRTIVGAVATQE